MSYTDFQVYKSPDFLSKKVTYKIVLELAAASHKYNISTISASSPGYNTQNNALQ